MFVFTMMTGHDDGNHTDGLFGVATWDVTRAHFCGEDRRWICTYPPEGHEQVDKLARLCRSMYGTRDVASIWGDTWSEVLKDGSMNVGTALPRFLFSVTTEISKDCVMVTTCAWWHDGSSCKSLGKSLKNDLR